MEITRDCHTEWPYLWGDCIAEIVTTNTHLCTRSHWGHRSRDSCLSVYKNQRYQDLSSEMQTRPLLAQTGGRWWHSSACRTSRTSHRSTGRCPTKTRIMCPSFWQTGATECHLVEWKWITFSGETKHMFGVWSVSCTGICDYITLFKMEDRHT